MANRPVFIPTGKSEHFVDEVAVDFKWNHGFATAQKKKNVLTLHEYAGKKRLYPLLEISTKSDNRLGKRLSAFSLKIETEIGKISLEAAYQGSKVFEKGGPYKDIYTKNSWDAKKDPRIRMSGALIGFNYFGQAWQLTPKTAFYDWLYLSSLKTHQEYLKRLYDYKGFTDIEFNPQKSVNCQARTCALLVSLLRLNLLDEALRSQHALIDMIAPHSLKQDLFEFTP